MFHYTSLFRIIPTSEIEDEPTVKETAQNLQLVSLKRLVAQVRKELLERKPLPMRFSHFIDLGLGIGARPVPPQDYPKDLPTTRVAEIEPMYVSFAWLHPHDNYCRRTMREMTTARTENEHTRLILPKKVLIELIMELRKANAAPLDTEIAMVWAPRLLPLPAARRLQ